MLTQTRLNQHFGHVSVKLNDFYDNAPVRIADFKRDYILSRSDERVRLIVLSVLSIPIWKITNYRSNNAPLLRYRNLALTFIGLEALNDIRPETILLENGRWFIVRGELAEDISFEYGTVLCRPVSIRVSDKSYLSPLLFEAYTRMDQSLSHNSFKSDVYSQGIVGWNSKQSVFGRLPQWR
ncbi:unnamed protein product [Sphagnum balticum]